VCLDTSSLIAYLQGDSGADVGLIDQALADQVGAISPVTVAELLSDPALSSMLKQTILELPVLQILGAGRSTPSKGDPKRPPSESCRYSYRPKLPRSPGNARHARSRLQSLCVRVGTPPCGALRVATPTA